PDAGFNGVDTFTYDISDGNGGTSQGTVTVKVMNPFTWDGGGGDALWSTGANWHGNVAPNGSQVAIFDATCSANCSPTISAYINVGGILMQAGYTGTITKSVGIDVGDLTIHGGTLSDASGAFFSVAGVFTQTGGTFSKTGGGRLSLHASQAADTTIFNHSAGTFTLTAGTLRFIGTRTQTYTIDVNPSISVGNVEFFVANNGGHTTTFLLAAGDAINATGDYSQGRSGVSDAFVRVDGATVNVAGDVYVGEGALGGTASLVVNGTALQRYDGTDTRFLPNLTVNKTAGSFEPFGGVTSLGLTSLTLTQGTFLAPTGTLVLNKRDAASSSIFTRTGGTFTPNSGTVKLMGTSGNATYLIDAPGTLTLNHLSLDTVNTSGETKTFNVAGGNTLQLTGNLSIARSSGTGQIALGGDVTLAGDLSVGAGANGGTAALTLNGTGAQTITHSGGTMPGGTFTINKASGTATLASALTLNSASQDLTVNTGTLDLAGFNLTVADAITGNNGAIIKLQGGQTITRTSATMNNGSLVQYTGTGSYATLALGHTYDVVEFVGVGGTYQHAAALTANAVNIGSGATLNSAGQTIYATHWNNQGSYVHGNNTVDLGGRHSQIRGSTTFYNLTKILSTSPRTIEFEAGATQTIAGALTLQGSAAWTLSLTSLTPGTRWNINPQGTRTISYLSVQDSNNTNATYINAYNTNSTNSGNNVGWNFAANSAPVAVADTYMVDQDSGATSFTVRSNDTDSNGDLLTITTVSNPPGGTATIVAGATIDYTPDAGFNGVDTFTYDISDGNGGTAQGTVTVKVMNPFTWDGGGGNASWTTGANWHGNVAPNNTQIAIFDGTCSSNCSPTVNAAVLVDGLRMSSTYAGTITQAAGQIFQVGASGWTMAGGTFVGSGAAIDVGGHFNLIGGTFTSTSGTLSLAQNANFTGTATFNHNNGTTRLFYSTSGTFTPAGRSFHHVTFEKNTNAILTISGTLSVGGNLIVNNTTGAG
ncbi:MAG TPA: Ig-like domain-containing protein, partial [Bdellovibrionales bacterium]|nr:Ig-like domain-containing protein [Bdellovibrionales bacterium]